MILLREGPKDLHLKVKERVEDKVHKTLEALPLSESSHTEQTQEPLARGWQVNICRIEVKKTKQQILFSPLKASSLIWESFEVC